MRTSGFVLPVMLLASMASAASGPSLPFLPTPSGSKAGPTMATSTYRPRAPVRHLPKGAPNVLIILLDDTGPAVPDTFGGEVHAPTLSRVVGTGIAFNRFHNAAMCSPTRAALLTGRNHHRVGFGQIAEFSNDWEGYSGVWPASSVSVARVLGEYGYSTAAFGKWHNTPGNEATAQGPFDRWPTGPIVGFDHFYGFLGGEASQWAPALFENTVRVEPNYPPGYHLTEDLAARAVAWIREQHALTPERPFFMYWAPGAAHGPHHIFSEWADKYRGKFDDGWDKLRERVFARQKKIGWLPPHTELTPRPDTLASWQDIPEAERPFQRRLMELYAGFVEHTDTQAGKILDELERLGLRDNTLIIYVWGDNGSSAEGQNGTLSELLAENGIPTRISEHLRALEQLGGLAALGGPKTAPMYHAGWAWAGSTPFQGTKLVASHFGGTRTPLAISWPKGVKVDDHVRSQFHHVNDIVPTLYEVIGIRSPQRVDGITQDPMDGVSLAYTFKDPSAPARKRSQYFEIMGSRAYYQDNFIASAFGPREPWVPGLPPGIRQWSPENDRWELYDLRTDFSQARDLAQQQPAKLAAMKRAFEATARENKVFPIGGGLWSIVFHPEDAPHNPATGFHYTSDIHSVPEGSSPKLGTQSNLAAVTVELQPNSQGVLYALGGFSGGLALWVDQGRVNYEYNLFEIERTRLQSSAPLPKGRSRIEVETRVAEGPQGSAEIVMRINGAEVARGTVPRTAHVFTANDTFDVGRDNFSPVSEAYFDRAPFAFNGKIESFDAKYLREAPGVGGSGEETPPSPGR